MALEQFEQLLRTQELDTRLSQIEHAIATHPLKDKIADLERASSAVSAGVQDEREERHKLERDQKRLDDEVAMIDAKRADIETKLYDGSITATKDLLAKQEESKHLAERKSLIEDDELEIMEQMEALQGVLDEAQAKIDANAASIEGFATELGHAEAELLGERGQVESERAAVVVSVPDELMSEYQRLRQDPGRIAVARLVGGACQACHMSLSAMTVDQFGKLPPEAVVHCDECGAILVR